MRCGKYFQHISFSFFETYTYFLLYAIIKVATGSQAVIANYLHFIMVGGCNVLYQPKIRYT